MDELRGIAGARPPSADEIAYARSITIGNLATRLENIDPQIVGEVANMARDHLPTTFYDAYVRGMGRVTPGDAAAAAAHYIDPAHTTIVVVGDRKRIEAGLRAANIGPVVIVDESGKPLP